MRRGIHRKEQSLLVALSCLLATLLAACDRAAETGADGEPNTGPARAVVTRYLEALEHRDRQELTDLAPPGYLTEDDVTDRLRRYGGVNAADASITLTSNVSPKVVTARISASLGEQRRSWTENVVLQDGSWYLLLGTAPGGPGRPTSGVSARTEDPAR